MLPTSLNLEEATIKETKQSISHQSSFIFTSFNDRKKNDIMQIRLNDNLTDLFTKFLPASTFKKLVNNIGMRHFKDLS
jgi:hypothetical protein